MYLNVLKLAQYLYDLPTYKCSCKLRKGSYMSPKLTYKRSKRLCKQRKWCKSFVMLSKYLQIVANHYKYIRHM